MDIRDRKQEEFVNLYLDGERRGILLLCPRFGKCRIGVKIMEKLGQPRTLISYPDNKIIISWEREMEILGYSNPNITFTNNMSLHKHENEDFDLIISDESQHLSERNIKSLQKLLQTCRASLGLSGTMSEGTKIALRNALKWPIIAEYGREEGIKDGIVSDYQINIITIPLDNKRLIQYKKKVKTEKGQFNSYSFLIKKFQEEGKDYFFLSLQRMRLIQNSVAKMEATRRLIKQFKDERVLVFCGLIKIADQLGIPVQHSESGDEESMTKFLDGEGNHLAVVKMGNTGLTYKPLSRVIINYFDSNPENLEQKISRAMNLEFKEKIADIYIISTNEEVERNWLHKALRPFNEKKIKWL